MSAFVACREKVREAHCIIILFIYTIKSTIYRSIQKAQFNSVRPIYVLPDDGSMSQEHVAMLYNQIN
jgi:hypothetical protein